jgi:hypothetical protein
MSQENDEFLKEQRGQERVEKILRGQEKEKKEEVTITDINISFGTVFRLFLQFTIASGIVGGFIWFLLFVFIFQWN